MNRANDSAFPIPSFQRQDGFIDWGQGGVTIREHFTGLAMQALIGTAAAPCLFGLGGAESPCAAAAVKMADALIAELAKPIEKD